MTISSADLVALFTALSDRLEAERDALCALDGQIGDADHGIAMNEGFAAVRVAQAALDPAVASPTDVFNTAAKSFLNAVGASSGPLYATAFLRAGAAVKGQAQVEDPGLLVEAIARGIAERGKAEPGEKTMIDAWAPAAAAVAEARAAGRSPAEALQAAAAAAASGAEATKDMLAAKGRASRLGERARGHVDPGAASAAIILAVMAEQLG